MKISCVHALALAASLLFLKSALAVPVTYTLYTVSDGALGSRSFVQRPVTITFQGNTANIVTTTTTSRTVYANYQGTATVSVNIGGKTFNAKFAPGQIYVRYDVKNGLVGFGSQVGPTYPLTLGCSNADCSLGQAGLTNGEGTVGALADIADDSLGFYTASQETFALPSMLSESTLLTGNAHVCAVPYPPDTSGQGYTGTLGPCPSSIALSTSEGPFYLQDQDQFTGENLGHVGLFVVQVGTGE